MKNLKILQKFIIIEKIEDFLDKKDIKL